MAKKLRTEAGAIGQASGWTRAENRGEWLAADSPLSLRRSARGSGSRHLLNGHQRVVVDRHVFAKGEAPIRRPRLGRRRGVFLLRKLLPRVVANNAQEVPWRTFDVGESHRATGGIGCDVLQHLLQLPSVTGSRHVVTDDVHAGFPGAALQTQGLAELVERRSGCE